MGKEDLRQKLSNAGNNAARERLFQQGLGINIPDTSSETPASSKASNFAKNYDDKPQFTRKTYYLTPEIVEAIRILGYKNRQDISELVRELLEKAIPEEIMEEAIENIKKLL